MRVAHLFAGLGGGILADLILGHDPVLAVENNPYCCQVLRERKNDGWFFDLEIVECDIREFDFTPWRGRVDQIAAGFPCQDISSAGRGEGITGARSGLISEVWRAIDAIRPALIFLENSPNIRTRGRTTIIKELVERGYSWRDGTLSASDVGAPHIRKRWWLLAADPSSAGGGIQSEPWWQNTTGLADGDQEPADVTGYGRNARRPECSEQSHGVTSSPSHAMRDRLQKSVQRGGLSESDAETIETAAGYTGAYDWAQVESCICGMAHGVSNRVESIKGLGNAQVPLQAALAWTILAGK